MSHRDSIRKIEEGLFEISPSGDMRVPARFYATDSLLDSVLRDNALDQLINVAGLTGIVDYALAMPDIHSGYGFPIGGVAAMDAKDGFISPGGVGYDINCGVRFITTGLTLRDIRPYLPKVLESLYKTVPSGLGSANAIPALSNHEIDRVLQCGSQWAVENGFGVSDDLDVTEDRGTLPGADPDRVSDLARKRGASQLGTLGSGNHFVEIARVKRVFDKHIAETLGLAENRIVVMIHSGSRGLGNQVCDDYLRTMLAGVKKGQFPDRQLVSVPIDSEQGRAYIGAMAAAGNYAFANRQVLMTLTLKAIAAVMGDRNLSAGLVYDLCHNIAKFEEHQTSRGRKRVCVHRKGATRAFGPGHPDVPHRYRTIGQPVIVPGDMGSSSYLCVGTEKAMRDTFGSSCHGAGRVMSRSAAMKQARPEQVREEMSQRGIIVKAASKDTLAEEMSEAYKDVSQVVQAMHDAGIVKQVVQTVPLVVLKG